MKWARILPLLIACAILIPHLHAEDRSVRLIFTPPELDGRFSIGVFDAKGKLVRTLFADAPPAYFQIALNGYQISWDGKTDDGQPAPAGKYSAHGYVVGEVKVEGEAFHFNDWVTGETEPIVERVRNLENNANKNKIVVDAKTGDGEATFEADALTKESRFVCKGFATESKELIPPSFLSAGSILSVAKGIEGTWWAVISNEENGKKATTLGQFSKEKDFMRELKQPLDEPPFSKVLAREDSSLIWALSEDQDRQIVRALKPAETIDGKPADDSSADWEIVFERNLQRCDHFGFKDGKLVPSIDGELTSPPINVRLIDNDLEPGVKQNAMLRPLQRKNGGWIATEDGLPLVRVSEIPSPRCALLLGNKPGSAEWYQLLGNAAVEEFRIEGLENLAKFDIGDFDLP